jgi:hypothetical protein
MALSRHPTQFLRLYRRLQLGAVDVGLLRSASENRRLRQATLRSHVQYSGAGPRLSVSRLPERSATRSGSSRRYVNRSGTRA